MNTQHALEIMKAAMPHLNTSTKNSVELAVKTGELMEAVTSLHTEGQLSACELDNEPIDTEALLVSIQEVCTSTEKETVNMILNFIKAQKLYQTYQLFKAANPGVGTESGKESKPFGPGAPSMMDFLKAQMPEEQRNTFDNLSMILNAMG